MQCVLTRQLPGLLLFLVVAVLCGCLPTPSGEQDEQREPHYLTGKARVAARDLRGAMEAFEAALEANPRNASAHYELGLLCEKVEDFAAAIYHLERYLKLRPNAPNAQIIRDRVNVDKMELAKSQAFAPVTQSLQRDLDRLVEERQQLRAELDKARAEIAQWRAYANRLSAPAPGPSTLSPGGRAGSVSNNPVAGLPATTAAGGGAMPPPSAPRVHSVQSGETMTSIAARYRVSVQQLQAANPQVDARRMKVGQVLRIPASSS